MWRIPLFDNVENANEDMRAIEHQRPDEAAINIYKLPSIEKV